ncbi:MAG: TetR/AcrR family transcriptional regulator [Bacteroidetes bacterium]|nr:TetR/AcrR family transcriptional regulator [Bacteroidota bacterium]
MPDELRNKIVDFAIKRFLQNGIRSMTIKKLVEPMGISTKTVYKYFDSKEALLKECLRNLYDGYYNELKGILNSDENPVNKLLILFRGTLGKDFGVNREFFHDLNYYYPELQNDAIGNASRNYGVLMVPLVESGIKEGYFLQYLDPQLALKGIVTLYTSITRGEEYRDYQGSPYPLFKNLVETYIRGMCTEKGIKEIDHNPYHND